MNKTSENYIKYISNKVEKTKALLESKKMVFLKSKDNETKKFNDNLSKFLTGFEKTEEIIKSYIIDLNIFINQIIL